MFSPDEKSIVARPVLRDGLRWRPSPAGLYLGCLWLALTFTPSLIPRPWLFQGLLAGTAFALGYGAGSAFVWLWNYLELPVPPADWRKWLYGLLVSITVLRMGWNLWNAADWQNSTRKLMGMPELEETRYLLVMLMAVVVAVALIGAVSALAAGIRWSAERSRRFVDRRIASVIGSMLFVAAVVVLVNGTFVSGAITLIDKLQAATDIRDPEGARPPAETTRSGGPGSLVAWDELGSAGKLFVHEGPRPGDIQAFTGRAAKSPIRIYVGLRAADDTRALAELAVEELKRTGAFSRKLLVIATPTGTGWVDNAGIAPLEYMHDGDTAVVGVQYSYLQSPLSLILEPGRSQASAAVVFETIHSYWKSLPEGTRPKLYLFGLSLGSHGSETSVPFYAYLQDPFQGAVWAGPPFRNTIWRSVQRNRNNGSAAWLPHFEDGSVIRVLGPSSPRDASTEKWGPIRLVYIVNPSDAIVFFQEDMWFREPDWMKQPRGEDVSPLFMWVPVISFFQVGIDMLSAANVATGHGHNYAAREYTDAWVAVSQPDEWTPADTDRLATQLAPPPASAANPQGG